MRNSLLTGAVLASFAIQGTAFAEMTTEERLSKMEKRMQIMEKKLAEQDQLIQEKDAQIAELSEQHDMAGRPT